MQEDAINEAVDKAVYEAVSEQLLIHGGITSAIVIAGFVILRFALVHFIRRKSEIMDKDQRRWINRINNGASIAIVVSLVMIWAPQLQMFALSLTAVAVAVVLTTKELLMCLTGGFFRASSHAFDVGDWITVDGITGEVMKITATTTLLQKLDTHGHSLEFTGETILIPNSRYLTASVENAKFTKTYCYHDVPLTVPSSNTDPAALMQELQNVVERHYAAFRTDALEFNRKVEKKTAVDFADPEPQFFLHTTDVGHQVFTARLFLPVQEASATASRIAQDFLAFAHQHKSAVTPVGNA